MLKLRQLSRTSLGKWLLGGFVCALLMGLIGFGLYHLVFQISLLKLWKPYAIISVLTLATFAAMYRANNSSSFNRTKRRAVVVGAYICSTSIVGIYYAAQAGIMPTNEVVGFSIFMTTGLVISSVLTYFVCKRLSQRG
jgi:hypothetical protein